MGSGDGASRRHCGRVSRVDLDAFGAVHGAQWDRLAELSTRRRLDGAEADELVQLYQAVATHLSTVRSAAPDPALVSRLSDLLGRARVAISGAHEPSWRDVTRFLMVALPAAFYRVRWWTVGVMVAFVAVAVVTGTWVVGSPEAQASLGTPSELAAYAEEAFAAYYSDYPAPSFAAQVWTNNAWIAAQCVAFGITGVWPALVLVQNAIGVGGAGAIMALHDRLDIFFALILPHGMLELTAIFIAGGAGLKLFWTVIDPGPRPRGQAVAEEGLALFSVAIGLVGVLGVSGLIEGFVTGSSMAWWAKIAVGALALAGYWVYTLVLGRRAVAGGETGSIRATERSETAPVAG